MPWKSMFQSGCTWKTFHFSGYVPNSPGVGLVPSWHYSPIVLSCLCLNTGSHTSKCMLPCLPPLGQCCFRVFLPTSYLFLCHLSNWWNCRLSRWEMVERNFYRFFIPRSAHWQNQGGRAQGRSSISQHCCWIEKLMGDLWKLLLP